MREARRGTLGGLASSGKPFGGDDPKKKKAEEEFPIATTTNCHKFSEL